MDVIFKELSATSSGINDVKGIFEEAKNTLRLTGRKTCLFMDEIQRFNKGQQVSAYLWKMRCANARRAGCVPALCGVGRSLPRRGYHRESLVQTQQCPTLSLPVCL